ncbi:MAG: hypothetical protein HQL32_04870 [Planctomycetes bacterium]|nr:hypothetical protein [Planctomycetota bacterium]
MKYIMNTSFIIGVILAACASAVGAESKGVFLIPSEAQLKSMKHSKEEILQNWTLQGSATWTLNFAEKFQGDLVLHYSCDKNEGGEATLSVDGKKIKNFYAIGKNAWWYKQVLKISDITMEPGSHTVEIAPVSLKNQWFMNFFGAVFTNAKIKKSRHFPPFPPAVTVYENRGSFSKTLLNVIENETYGVGAARKSKTLIKKFWGDYPQHMCWLTQDIVKKDEARLNSEYPVDKDIAAFFNNNRDASIEKKALQSVLDELGKQGRAITEKFQVLLAESPAITDERWLNLYEEACLMRRSERLKPLLAKTEQIVFAKHQVFGSKSNILYINETEGTDEESHLCSIDLKSEKNGSFAKVSNLVDSKGGMIRDPNVSFDGKRMLFAWRKTRENISSRAGAPEKGNYQIYEMEMATGDIRQLTTDETYGANFEPIYLPNDDIMFSSARIVQHITCGWGDCSNLFLMNGDGQYQRRVGFDQTNTMSPAVINDGRVLFLRRDYNDRGQSSAHALFQMMPDGTNQSEYYGNQTGTPNSFQHPAAIPGTSKIAIVLGGYHTRQGGQLAIMDIRDGRQNADGLVRIPQGDRPSTKPGHDDGYAKKGIQYSNPYPLSETEFIVSRSETWGKGSSEHYRVFYMTADGRRELLASDPRTSCLQPVAIMPRKKPAVRPSMVDYTKKTSTLYLQNAYFGEAVKGVESGGIKKVRVVELLYKPDTIGAGMGKGPGGMWHTVTPTGHPLASFDSKRILGDATVYDDGSSMFDVPARTPIYLQLLDAKNHVVQTMRSWTTLMPGERLSCVGCHERKDETPLMGGRMTTAMKKGVETLKPFYGPARAFSYLNEVQPVFDKHCIDCHTKGEKGGKELILTATPFVSEKSDSAQFTGRKFAQSYVNLVAARPAQEGISVSEYAVKSSIPSWNRSGEAMADEPNKHISYWTRFELMGPMKPYRAGSIRSGLVEKLEKGHVKNLPSEALDKIKAWIDLNLVYAGEYDDANNWTADQVKRYNDRMAERKRNEDIEEKAISDLLGAINKGE